MKSETIHCDKCEADITDHSYYEKENQQWCEQCIYEYILKKKGWERR